MEIVLTAGGSITASLIFDPILLKTKLEGHQRPNETLPCPYNAVCWIHMEE
jgi:hypothetical protein